jgi:8-oxo-dGTP pyrophosphatase MutT (NUDIX family)
MTWRDIRPLALGAVRDGDELMLAEHYDPEEEYTFYRPLGGGIEFGEHSEEAVAREFDEELGVELDTVEYVETYERTFSFAESVGHEIWQLYEVSIVEDWPYERERFTAEEPELDETFEVVWKDVADFETGDDVLYPPDLIDDLTRAGR